MVGVEHTFKNNLGTFLIAILTIFFSAIVDIKFVLVGFQIKFRVPNLTQYLFFLRLINAIEVYDMLI